MTLKPFRLSFVEGWIKTVWSEFIWYTKLNVNLFLHRFVIYLFTFWIGCIRTLAPNFQYRADPHKIVIYDLDKPNANCTCDKAADSQDNNIYFSRTPRIYEQTQMYS